MQIYCIPLQTALPSQLWSMGIGKSCRSSKGEVTMRYPTDKARAAGMHHLCKYYRPEWLAIGLAVLMISISPVQAGQHRHHDAHKHGIAELNVAIEGSSVYIEFTSPAANIVGFEHHPRTGDQQQAVEEALNSLKKGETLFILSETSGSQLVTSSVQTDIAENGDHHKDTAHHEDGDHHAESEHAHAKEGEEGHHGHEDHHHKEHGEAAQSGRHSDFKAQYHFTCKTPDKLSQIEVMLFRRFPGIEHIEVQLLNETTQTAMELTAKKNQISW